MKTIFRNVSVVTIIVACSITSQTQALSDDAVLQMLETVVKKLENTFPKRVDEYTVVYAAQPDYRIKRRLIYYYRVELHRNEIEDLRSFQREALQASINFYCSQPSLKPFRDIDVSFEYNYVDNTKTYLFSNIVDISKC